MANTYTSQDLVKRTLQYSGEVTDGTSPFHDLALIYLNKVYHGILAGESEFAPDVGEPWIWARALQPINLILQPVYTSGTVTINQSSTAGTFSVAPSVSFQTAYLKVDANPTFYLITSHVTGSTSFTIDTPLLESSVNAGAFHVYPLIYDLSALAPNPILRLVEPFRVYDVNNPMPFVDTEQMGKIYGIDLNRFQKEYPLTMLTSGGAPERFATYRRTDTIWQVIFNEAPITAAMKVDIDYIPLVDDLIDSNTSVPLLPKMSRPLLADGAAFYLLTDKEDEKAQVYFSRCKAAIETMMRAHNRLIWKTAKERGRLIPRQELQKNKFNYYW